MNSNCKNKVPYSVQSGWDYKTVETTCGGTDVYGGIAECEKCRSVRERNNAPPPGYCRHGVFVLTDHDIPCAACEFGED